MRIVVLAGGALLLAALGLKLLSHKSSASVYVAPPVHKTRSHTASSKTGASHKAKAPRVQIDETLPAPLRRALARHGVVVAVLYADVPGDKDAVQAARNGAHAAHVGFTALNVRNEAVATRVALKLPGSTDPSVVIVRRPGTISL